MSDPDPTFADLGLAPALLTALEGLGYTTPTPIQQGAIPALLAGTDLIGQAQTGTGKTAAFGLPLLQSVEVTDRFVQGLIMAPTRELAMQVAAALKGYAKGIKGLRVLTVYGGANIVPQLRALDRGVHVVVGTPGRIADCMRRGALKLGQVRFAVLDEADEMLQMGFAEDVEAILGATPDGRQMAFFSATMPPAVRRIADRFLSDPQTVQTKSETRTVAEVSQHVLVARLHDKVDVLARVLEVAEMNATLVFVRTRAGCRELAASLEARGFATAALHGDLGQQEREQVVERLRDGRINLVVATDVAARGLDVDCISHVVNFDPPDNPEIYVHRIGRTGRAGREGVSILILTPREQRLQRGIERFTRQRMTQMQVPSNAEIAAGRGRRLAATVKTVMAEADLAPYQALVAQLVVEADGDAMAIAAALARMCVGDRPLRVDLPEPFQAAPIRAPRPASRQLSARRPDRRGPSGPTDRTRLFIALGFRAGLRPGDIVGAIANETGLSGREIGPIEIRERHSFVGVPVDRAEEVLARMANATIRGRNARFSAARPGGRDLGERDDW